MTVYLLHYTQPIGNTANPRGTAQHYLGSTNDLERRLTQHEAGKSGAGIVRAFVAAGVTFVLARTWEGGKQEERKLKNWHKARQLCPICRHTGQPIEWHNHNGHEPDQPTEEIPF